MGGNRGAVFHTKRCAGAVVIAGLGLVAACASNDQLRLGSIPESQVRSKASQLFTASREWLAANVSEDGSVPYLLDWPTGVARPGDNDIRQLMTTRLLAELAQRDTTMTHLHARNLRHALSRYYRVIDDTMAYVIFDGKAKLGGMAMALRAIVASPDYHLHADKARRLATGITSLMDSTGALRPWAIEPPYKYDAERLMTFYSGEAILSLLEFWQKEPGNALLEKALRAQAFYIQRYVNHIDRHYYPAYVPWHVMSLSASWRITGDTTYALSAFRLADTLLVLQDTVQYPGRFYNPNYGHFGSPHSSSDGVYTEGIAYALELAIALKQDKRAARYRRALQYALHNLLSLQIQPWEVWGSPNASRAQGAIRIRNRSMQTRVDCTQHTMDAVLQILRVW
jgi:hypothetical protein